MVSYTIQLVAISQQHYFLSPTLQILDICVGCNRKSARSVLATGHSCSLLTILNHIYKKKKEQGTTYLLYSIKTIFTINTTANFYLTVKSFSYFVMISFISVPTLSFVTMTVFGSRTICPRS